MNQLLLAVHLIYTLTVLIVGFYGFKIILAIYKREEAELSLGDKIYCWFIFLIFISGFLTFAGIGIYAVVRCIP